MKHPLLQTLTAKLADIDAQGLRRKRWSAETPCQPHLVTDGKPMLAFNSNDYLGLARLYTAQAAVHRTSSAGIFNRMCD
jgi:7-keto-8-aminopelargonate synthetase-like enzyme